MKLNFVQKFFLLVFLVFTVCLLPGLIPLASAGAPVFDLSESFPDGSWSGKAVQKNSKGELIHIDVLRRITSIGLISTQKK